MKLAIMQPYFFPYIGYWQLLNAVDVFVIFDDVNFKKKGYINRNTILINSHSKLITLELLKASQNNLINEISIGSNSKKLLKTIEMSYKKAPYFDTCFPIIEEILKQREQNLANFLAMSIKTIADYLQIKTKIIYSSKIEKNKHLKAQDKIIDVAKSLKAKYYINLINGQSLYNKHAFKQERIELSFMKTEFEKYKQFDNQFVPSLSIIDILMFNNIDETKIMLNKYTLI